MTANPLRGEVEIRLSGNYYLMRPSFAALSRIEQELQTGLILLAGKLAEGSITIEALAVIVRQCVLQDISLSFVQDALVEDGLGAGISAVSDMFALLFGGMNEAIA